MCEEKLGAGRQNSVEVSSHSALTGTLSQEQRSGERNPNRGSRSPGSWHELAAIVESSADAIVGQPLEGIITTWNPAAERLFAYTEDELLGKPISLLIPLELSEELPSILERVRRGKGPGLRDGAGAERWHASASVSEFLSLQ